MIRQSFQNIVNPLNIIENFDSHENTQDNTHDYSKLISDMNTECDSIINDMDIKYDIGNQNKCIVSGRTFAKSNKEYKNLREENLQKYEKEYNDLKENTTIQEGDKNKKIACLMNKLFINIEKVSEQNKKMGSENKNKEEDTIENELIIKQNILDKKKDKNLNLVTNANVIGTKESKRIIRIQYIIFLVLIAIFLIIQLVIFFV